MMRLQTSRNIRGFWKLCLTLFLKMLAFVTSPNNSFVRPQTKNWGSCKYKYTHLKRQKSINMTAANPTQRSGDSHKKSFTFKRRIHDFYLFCIDECKAIILASGTINCYCCCCCCCILMSRYIFKRVVEGTVFLLIHGMAMGPCDLYTICIQKVYTNLLYCT